MSSKEAKEAAAEEPAWKRKEDAVREEAEAFWDELLKETETDSTEAEALEARIREYESGRTVRAAKARSKAKDALAAISTAFLLIFLISGAVWIFAGRDGTAGACALAAAGVSLASGLGAFAMRGSLSKRLEELNRENRGRKEKLAECLKPAKEALGWGLQEAIVSRAVPELTFDGAMSTATFDTFREKLGMNAGKGAGRTMLWMKSGSFCGRPFVMTKELIWSKGTKEARNGDAVIVCEAPRFSARTAVWTCSSACPGLSFSRRPQSEATVGTTPDGTTEWYGFDASGMDRESVTGADKDVCLTAPLDPAFEKEFHAWNRSDARLFSNLFTPSAQENMKGILEGRASQYGDDFWMVRKRRLACVVSRHSQLIGYDVDPQLAYWSAETLGELREAVVDRTAEWFGGLWADLQPVMAVPLLMQADPVEASEAAERRSAKALGETEYAIAAESFSRRFLADDGTSTPVIVRCRRIRGSGKADIVGVESSGYAPEECVGEAPSASDGSKRQVRWTRYAPTLKQSVMVMFRADMTEGESRELMKDAAFMKACDGLGALQISFRDGVMAVLCGQRIAHASDAGACEKAAADWNARKRG